MSHMKWFWVIRNTTPRHMFEVVNTDRHDQSTAANYEQDLRSTLQDTFHQVIKTLQLSKQKMQEHYNRRLISRNINHKETL